MDIIIGLIGAKQAGKTTAFETLSRMVPVEEITLAAKLKDVCSEIFEVPREAFDKSHLKEQSFDIPINLDVSNLNRVFSSYGLRPDYDKFIRPHIGKILYSPRQIAQYVGTEVLRAFEPDIHCRVAAENCLGTIGIVTDMRFPNEYEYFAKHSGFIPVYIKNRAAEMAASRDTHSSEAHLKALAAKAWITIENNKDINTYKKKIQEEFSRILERVYSGASV